MLDSRENTPPEPYFSGYLLLLYRVFVELRLRTQQPETMSNAELVSIVKDMNELADALHNIPLFLAGMDNSFTPEDMEELFIKAYDQADAGSGRKLFQLCDLLRRCTLEAKSKQNG